MINLFLLIAVALWGLSFISTKIVLGYLNPLEIIAFRFIFGIPTLFLISKIKHKETKIEKKDLPVLLITSIVFGSHFVIQAFGLIYTTATNSAWLIATIPVFTAIAARIFLKEKIGAKKILGIIIATFGVLLLISKGRLNSFEWLKSTGDWIILSSCITWTTYTVATRNITHKYNTLGLIKRLMILPGILLGGYVLLVTPLSKLGGLPIEVWLHLIFLGVFMMGIANWLWLVGLSRIGATKAGVFLYVEPMFTTAAAVPFLGENVTVALIIGAVLIIGGVYIVQRKNAVS